MIEEKQLNDVFRIGFIFIFLTVMSKEARFYHDVIFSAVRASQNQNLIVRKPNSSPAGPPSISGSKINFAIPPDPGAKIAPLSAVALNAAVPISLAQNPPASPFILKGDEDDRARAVQCLTQAVYYEAGFESGAGQEAVAQVVLNRLRHPIFPKSVCGVVFQGATLKTGCQFSFTCDGSLSRVPQKAAWERSKFVAEQALNGFVQKNVGQATHYHTQWVVPWWRPTVTKVAQIGAHIFYRWPGALGLPAAFNGRYSGHEQIATLSQNALGRTKADDDHLYRDGSEPAAGGSLANAPLIPISPRQRLLALSARGLLGDKATFDANPSSKASYPTEAAATHTP